jgi:hypothetical protein
MKHAVALDEEIRVDEDAGKAQMILSITKPFVELVEEEAMMTLNGMKRMEMRLELKGC